MSEGPIDCQTDGTGAGTVTAARIRARDRRRAGWRLLSLVAALTMAAARDFAAGARRVAGRIRVGAFARNARLVRPNFGRAAFGTATAATTSSLRVGLRLPR